MKMRCKPFVRRSTHEDVSSVLDSRPSRSVAISTSGLANIDSSIVSSSVLSWPRVESHPSVAAKSVEPRIPVRVAVSSGSTVAVSSCPPSTVVSQVESSSPPVVSSQRITVTVSSKPYSCTRVLPALSSRPVSSVQPVFRPSRPPIMFLRFVLLVVPVWLRLPFGFVLWFMPVLHRV